MSGLVACVAGSTGLTGRALIEQLRGDAAYAKVYALVRKRGGMFADARVLECVVDFEKLAGGEPLPVKQIDHAFCCLGTTIKLAGSQAAFKRVDLDYVVAFASAARAQGARHFSVISALGASERSPVFYSRIKGQMQAAVAKLGFASVHILQPSFLVGGRQEARPGERLGIAAASAIAPLLIGPARKYRPIHVNVVAKAMRVGARDAQPGVQVSLSDRVTEIGANERRASQEKNAAEI